MTKLSNEQLENIYNYTKEQMEIIPRKCSTDNQFNHCEHVAELVTSLVGNYNNLNTCALLHDIFEDSPTKRDKLKELGLSNKEIKIILELTNIQSRIDNIGRTKYMAYKLDIISNEALLIKLADRLDNVWSCDKMREHEEYAKKTKKIERRISAYLSETFYILSILEDRIDEITNAIDNENDFEINEYKIMCGITTLYNQINQALMEIRF